MQPKSSWLLDLGIWWMQRDRERAMWWYNRVFMPLGLRFQKRLNFSPGLIDTLGSMRFCWCAGKRAERRGWDACAAG